MDLKTAFPVERTRRSGTSVYLIHFKECFLLILSEAGLCYFSSACKSKPTDEYISEIQLVYSPTSTSINEGFLTEIDYHYAVPSNEVKDSEGNTATVFKITDGSKVLISESLFEPHVVRSREHQYGEDTHEVFIPIEYDNPALGATLSGYL